MVEGHEPGRESAEAQPTGEDGSPGLASLSPLLKNLKHAKFHEVYARARTLFFQKNRNQRRNLS